MREKENVFSSVNSNRNFSSFLAARHIPLVVRALRVVLVKVLLVPELQHVGVLRSSGCSELVEPFSAEASGRREVFTLKVARIHIF